MIPLTKPKPVELFTGMPNDEYRAHPALSQSDLSWMGKSPQHYKRRAELREETGSMRFGAIFHKALLEPKAFCDSYIIEPDKIPIDGNLVEVNRRVPKHRAYLAAWRVDNSHRMIVTEKEMESLHRMITSVTADPELVELIQGGETEVVSFWDYKGRACKGRADLFNDKTPHGRVVIDFKKTQDASESGFDRSIRNYNYDLQDAFYSEGFQADKFFFVAIEEKTGAIGKWDGDLYLERGRKKMDRWMDRLNECEQKNEWPWYTKGFEPIRPANWIAGMDEENI